MMKEETRQQTEVFYQQSVMNPYPEDSQSNTAYKKGFYECAEWMAGEADRLREERGELRELVLFAIDRIDAVEAKEAIKAMLSVILQPKLSDHA